jgi:hypothetical protein
MPKTQFMRRYWPAVIFGLGTIALLIASLLCETFWSAFWWSLGTLICGGLTVWQLVDKIRTGDPTRFVFEHADWIFDPNDLKPLKIMPYIEIPRSQHKRGLRPRIEFQQVDPLFGVPNFPTNVDEDGNIRITRPQMQSMPPYPPF